MSGPAETRSDSSEHRDGAQRGGRLPSSSRSTSAAKLGHRDGGSRRDRPARACESPRGPGRRRRREAAGWDGWCRLGIPTDRRRDRRRRVEVAPRRDPPPSRTRWWRRTPRGSAGWDGPERELPCRSPGVAGDTGPVAGLHRLGSRSWRLGVGAPWVPGGPTHLRRVATSGARAHAHTTGEGSAWHEAVRPLTLREGVSDPDAAPPEGVDPAPSTGDVEQLEAAESPWCSIVAVNERPFLSISAGLVAEIQVSRANAWRSWRSTRRSCSTRSLRVPFLARRPPPRSDRPSRCLRRSAPQAWPARPGGWGWCGLLSVDQVEPCRQLAKERLGDGRRARPATPGQAVTLAFMRSNSSSSMTPSALRDASFDSWSASLGGVAAASRT